MPSQEDFFKLACSLWNPPECDVKVTRGRDPDVCDADETSQIVEDSCPADTTDVQFHYVGHFGSFQTNDDIERLVQVCLDHSCDVYMNNTACSSMENPEDVQGFLDGFDLPPGVELVYRGNQCTSIGDWRPLCPTANTECTVMYGCEAGPAYPPCSDYEGRMCIDWMQGGETMTCRDDSGQTQELECCTDELIDTWEQVGGGCEYPLCSDLDGDLCVSWLDDNRECETRDGTTGQVTCCEEGFWDHWRDDCQTGTAVIFDSRKTLTTR